MPHVVRFELTLASTSYHGTTTTGLQFPSHAGDAAAVAGRPRAQTLRAHTTAAGTLILESTAATSLRASLTRDGIAWKGTYVDTSASKQSRGLTCWSAADLTPSRIGRRNPALPAHFDWTKHKCVDTRGRAAHNRIPIEVIRETTFGECADLSGVSLNGGDLGYPELLYWQLMGAKLGGATLHFANLRSASLQGADLGAFDFGYARVQGVIDDATLLPTSQGGTCSLTSSPWAGKSCDCVR